MQRWRQRWRTRRSCRRRQPGQIRLRWRHRWRRWRECRNALPQFPRSGSNTSKRGVAVVHVGLGVFEQATLRIVKIQVAVDATPNRHIVAVCCVAIAVAAASRWKIGVHIEPRTSCFCARTDVHVRRVWIVHRVRTLDDSVGNVLVQDSAWRKNSKRARYSRRVWHRRRKRRSALHTPPNVSSH